MTTLRFLLCVLSSVTWHACGVNAWNWKYWSISIMFSARCCSLHRKNVFISGPAGIIPDCLQVPMGVHLHCMWMSHLLVLLIDRHETVVDLWFCGDRENSLNFMISRYLHVFFWTAPMTSVSLWLPLPFHPEGIHFKTCDVSPCLFKGDFHLGYWPLNVTLVQCGALNKHTCFVFCVP